MLLPEVGLAVGVSDVDTPGVGDIDGDDVGAVVGDVVPPRLGVGVTDGVGVGDGDVLGTTAPPTALPARHTKTYSVAPGGGATITGVGDPTTGGVLAATGAETAGDATCFVGVGRAGGGVGLGGRVTGVPTDGVATCVGVNVAEFADAAEAD